MAQKERGKHIHWTNEETNKVVDEASRLYSESIIQYWGPSLFQAQQNVLPTNRWKTNSTLRTTSGKYRNILRQRSAQQVSENTTSTIPEPIAQQKEDTEMKSSANIIQFIQTPGLTESIEKSNDFIDIDSKINDYISQQAKIFEDKYRQTIRARINERVDELIANITLDIPVEVDNEFQRRLRAATRNQEKVKLYRVLVVGLLPNQVTIIKKEYGKSLNLTFVESDKSMDRLKSLAPQMDYVVMMKRFINHNHTDIVNKQTHKGFILISGGMSDLSQALLELACQ